MARKDKKGQNHDEDAGPAPTVNKGNNGGARFDSSDATLDAAKAIVNLEHITKPWTRATWEKSTPFLLEQRQKLEGQGWSPVDPARTELYVLRRNAPHGAYTEDGFMYVRVPKKFIDFTRSGKASDDGAADAGDDDGAKKKRVSKKKADAQSYDLTSEHVWKVKIDGESQETDRAPSVILDVLEPLENLFYLVMCLQPGMAQLWAQRKDVTQAGTLVSDVRDDAEEPTVRHRAMVAASESYTRVLPPSFWFKRNSEELRKMFGDADFEALAAAAEDEARSVTRDVKDVREKTWEEKLKVDPAKKATKKDKAAKSTPVVDAAAA